MNVNFFLGFAWGNSFLNFCQGFLEKKNTLCVINKLATTKFFITNLCTRGLL